MPRHQGTGGKNALKNGRGVKVGDLVVGHTDNTEGIQVGVLGSITPGTDTCNAIVALLKRVPVEKVGLIGSPVAMLLRAENGGTSGELGAVLCACGRHRHGRPHAGVQGPEGQCAEQPRPLRRGCAGRAGGDHAGKREAGSDPGPGRAGVGRPRSENARTVLTARRERNAARRDARSTLGGPWREGWPPESGPVRLRSRATSGRGQKGRCSSG